MEAAVYSQEQEMQTNILLIENDAATLSILNDQQYQEAGEFVKMVKANMKTVKDYFAPMKEAAHKSHQAVCEREKEMLDPLLKAEKTCKAQMAEYLRRKQEEARKQEELMRRLAQEEAEKKLAEAIKAEKNGDDEAAALAFAQATVAEQVGSNTVVQAFAPKVAGISTSKDYEIILMDHNAVPITVSGVVIRPVDEKAIMKLIKASNGTIQIPGIKYRETVRMSVSGGR